MSKREKDKSQIHFHIPFTLWSSFYVFFSRLYFKVAIRLFLGKCVTSRLKNVKNHVHILYLVFSRVWYWKRVWILWCQKFDINFPHWFDFWRLRSYKSYNFYVFNLFTIIISRKSCFIKARFWIYINIGFVLVWYWNLLLKFDKI